MQEKGATTLHIVISVPKTAREAAVETLERLGLPIPSYLHDRDIVSPETRHAERVDILIGTPITAREAALRRFQELGLAPPPYLFDPS